MIKMNYNLLTVCLSISAVLITFIISNGITEHKKVLAMGEAVSQAAEKGINPIATRCAFAKSDDNICIVYAAKNPHLQTIEK
jgi:hypothetical protein